MTDGLYINGSRPKNKKELKEALEKNPGCVEVECTSMFGKGFEGSISNLQEGQTITFVGPDPHTKRTFYGTLTRKGNTFIVK